MHERKFCAWNESWNKLEFDSTICIDDDIKQIPRPSNPGKLIVFPCT